MKLLTLNLRRNFLRNTASMLIPLLLLPSLPGQSTAAPQPAMMRSAHTVFLANAGAQTGFPYDASVAYQQFLDSLRAWGHFTLADSPAQADLIFELRSAAPIDGVVVLDGTGGSYRQPSLELTIIDPRTQTHLWVLSEPLYTRLARKDKTDWFTVAVNNLTTKVKELSGDPVSAVETAELAQVPKAGHHLWVWAVIGAPIALGVGGGFLLHHEFTNSLADQKSQQDAFCTANHIPASQCLGG